LADNVSLPNLITGVRIALVPILVVLLRDPTPASSLAAGFTFFVACWTDFFDGYVARRRGQVTNLGKFLDPLADKLIVVSVLIMLVAMPEPRVPAWMVVLIVGREFAVTGLRAIAVGSGVMLEAEELGKYKTILQMFALHGLLLHYPFGGIDFQTAGMYFLWISLGFGLWSATDYHIRVFRLIQGQSNQQDAS
jgi:CDP-diacylglycerol--glycerol-3-phosphate 3-phosphatidyltransferase